mmetsp:Transcript_8786/g.18778  ORF Transcript_8786/g.18778 Transcript_8786/m.18778 type:complete len:264 (+) Transcript_8786:592-1383(+)
MWVCMWELPHTGATLLCDCVLMSPTDEHGHEKIDTGSGGGGSPLVLVSCKPACLTNTSLRQGVKTWVPSPPLHICRLLCSTGAGCLVLCRGSSRSSSSRHCLDSARLLIMRLLGISGSPLLTLCPLLPENALHLLEVLHQLRGSSLGTVGLLGILRILVDDTGGPGLDARGVGDDPDEVEDEAHDGACSSHTEAVLQVRDAVPVLIGPPAREVCNDEEQHCGHGVHHHAGLPEVHGDGGHGEQQGGGQQLAGKLQPHAPPWQA